MIQDVHPRFLILIFHPGSRCQKGTGSRIRNTGGKYKRIKRLDEDNFFKAWRILVRCELRLLSLLLFVSSLELLPLQR
jgi:hypothetical protein